MLFRKFELSGAGNLNLSFEISNRLFATQIKFEVWKSRGETGGFQATFLPSDQVLEE